MSALSNIFNVKNLEGAAWDVTHPRQPVQNNPVYTQPHYTPFAGLATRFANSPIGNALYGAMDQRNAFDTQNPAYQNHLRQQYIESYPYSSPQMMQHVQSAVPSHQHYQMMQQQYPI